MNRRELLKITGFASMSAILSPTLMSFTKTNKKSVIAIPPGFIQFQMGDLELLILTDGYVPMKNLQPVFAPDVKTEDVNTKTSKMFEKTENVEISINIMLIKKQEQLILIDVGSGPHFGETEGWLPQSLHEAGISTSEITDIFITHAHRDHIGGILDKESKLIFPNAKYHISPKEFNFWTSEKPDFSKSKLSNYPETGVSFTKNILQKIKDKLYFYEHGELLFDCLKPELAEGHTPGHTIFSVFSKEKIVTHIVDTVHNQLLIEKPEWGIQWDVDFKKGIQTRIEILGKVSKNNELVISTHLPWPGIGHIINTDNGFKWKPLAYSTPRKITI
ncbi:MAG: MBL fold metallo-hydrolase [Algibacter sp.]